VAATVTGIGIAGVGLGAGCSARHDPAGGLLLSIDTNLKVPDDIDTIGISVSRATDGGVESEDDLFPLAPNGMAKFPATLTLLRGTGEPLQISAVGYKDGVAIALRQVVTTLPSDHVAILPMELNWLDKPLVSGTTEESVQSVTSSCGALEGPVAGTCTSFQLDSATLATYAPAAIVPSDGAAAVDCDSCFASGQAVTVDKASCTFTPAAGVADASAINVVFQLAAGHAAGWCNGGSCIIPLPHDSAEGWSLGSDGLIHLPPAACTSAAVGSVIVAPATASCPVLSSEHPAKQEYGTVASPQDAGDATTAPADAGDAEAARPPSEVAFTALPDVVSLTSDGTTLYVLRATGNVNAATMLLSQLPIDFANDATAPARDVSVAGQSPPPAGTPLASAAGLGFYAYGTTSSGGNSAAVYVVALDGATGTSTIPLATGACVDIDIAAGSIPGQVFVSYVDSQGLQGLRLVLAPDGGSPTASTAPLPAAGLTSSGRFTPADGGAPLYVFGDSSSSVSTAPYFDDGGLTFVGSFSAAGAPYSFASAAGSIFILDGTSSVFQLGVNAPFITLAPVVPSRMKIEPARRTRSRPPPARSSSWTARAASSSWGSMLRSSPSPRSCRAR
jgi:hypothetical protein